MSKIVIYPGKGDQWFWRLKDGNHKIIAVGGEGFESEASVRKSVANVLSEVSENSPIVPEDDEKDGSAHTRFAYFVGEDDQYYWHLQNKGNNRKIASGGEGFASKGNVIRSLENVRQEIAAGPVVVSEGDTGEAPDDKSRSKSYVLIVNSEEKEWDGSKISFAEIVDLALGEYLEGVDSVAYTVQYVCGPRENGEGVLVEGREVRVKDGMQFNVSKTDRS